MKPKYLSCVAKETCGLVWRDIRPLVRPVIIVLAIILITTVVGFGELFLAGYIAERCAPPESVEATTAFLMFAMFIVDIVIAIICMYIYERVIDAMWICNDRYQRTKGDAP